jgi:hypothetical protein
LTPSSQAIECRCRRDQETSKKLLADLAVLWEEHGKDVLEKSAMDGWENCSMITIVQFRPSQSEKHDYRQREYLTEGQ